ncbi:hypothetical protein Clacol_004298 [Clathrus columnatus]|uniref:Uncharacterized protein n=1 Tax=Clathrus columnatus TaxID=1419009 RepID=A0AAV5A8R4_9AGAM|nr:hypothetical protein Clacol_004298 [Clathrus columnatus]
MIVSSPSVPSSSPVGSPVPMDSFDDEQHKLRLQIFGKCKSLMNQANERGYILNWENRIAKSPVPWYWPLDEDGNRFPAAMLNHAYIHYDFSPPCCPCNTQGVNPNVNHHAKIWVVRNPDSKFHQTIALGCRSHYQGCAIFVPMMEMEDHPELLTQKYPCRKFPQKGLIGFDPVGSLPSSQKTLSTPSLSVPASPVPSSPVRFISQSRNTGFSSSRGKKRTSPNTLSLLLSSLKKAKPDDHYDFKQEEDSDNDVNFSFPPSVQRPPKYWSSSPIIISDSEKSDSAGQSKNEKTNTVVKIPRSILPSEHFFGDTDAISSPPDIKYTFQKNSEVPPLSQAEMTAALEDLQSGQGIKTETMWRMYDKCDCSAWVRKDMIAIHNEKYCILSSHSMTHAPINMSLTMMSSALPPKTPPPASLSDPFVIGRCSPHSPVATRSSKLRNYDHPIYSQQYHTVSSSPISSNRNGSYTLPPMPSVTPFSTYDISHHRYAGSSKNSEPSYHPLTLHSTLSGQAPMSFVDSSAPTYLNNSSASSSVNSLSSYFTSSMDPQF